METGWWNRGSRTEPLNKIGKTVPRRKPVGFAEVHAFVNM